MSVSSEVKVLKGKSGGDEGDETGGCKKGGVSTVGGVEVCCDEM